MGCEWPVTHLFYLLGFGTDCVEIGFFLAEEICAEICASEQTIR